MEQGAAHTMPDADPDSDILALVASSDMNGAIQLLMRRHGPAVYRFCRESVRNPAVADDVHQQVFIEAFRDLPQFRGQSQLRTWLFGIARHRCLDANKVARRDEARVEPDLPTSVADSRPAVGEAIDDRRLGEALLACMAKLDPEVRAAVLLRFQQGFTFEQMAAMTGKKSGTLQAKVSRAMPILRRCIETRTGGSL